MNGLHRTADCSKQENHTASLSVICSEVGASGIFSNDAIAVNLVAVWNGLPRTSTLTTSFTGTIRRSDDDGVCSKQEKKVASFKRVVYRSLSGIVTQQKVGCRLARQSGSQ